MFCHECLCVCNIAQSNHQSFWYSNGSSIAVSSQCISFQVLRSKKRRTNSSLALFLISWFFFGMGGNSIIRFQVHIFGVLCEFFFIFSFLAAPFLNFSFSRRMKCRQTSFAYNLYLFNWHCEIGTSIDQARQSAFSIAMKKE